MRTHTIIMCRGSHGDRQPESRGCGFFRAGMSTIELLASIIVISGILGMLVVISHSLRTESVRRQTLDILRHLRAALESYQGAYHAYPPGPTSDALASLFDDVHAQKQLQTLTPQTDSAGRMLIHDGYGRPVRYLAPADLALLRRNAPTGHVDFVSAGADGRLGDIASSDSDEVAAVTDNLYGSDTERARP